MVLLWTTNDRVTLEKLSDHLSYLNGKHNGKNVDYIVEIKKNYPVRSNDQNRRYWAILKAISVKTGYDKDELHIYYKCKFLAHESRPRVVFDEAIITIPSSHDKNTAEFASYVNQVESHARKVVGIEILHPAHKDYAAWEMATRSEYNEMFIGV